jgi:hypothetical protein
MPAIDLFNSALRLPAKVCILAPGPNGKKHYHEIPADYEVIAVNKAVLIDEVPRKQFWMMNHATQEWFDRANAAFHGVRVFSADALREARARLDPGEPCYYYRAPPDTLDPDTVSRVGGAIRYGTTVSGCAVQFAYNFGACDILLCGVDMSGDDYWDGTRNVHPHHGAIWPAAGTLSRLIRWLNDERGVRVTTLSETRLDAPTFSPVRREAP